MEKNGYKDGIPNGYWEITNYNDDTISCGYFEYGSKIGVWYDYYRFTNEIRKISNYSEFRIFRWFVVRNKKSIAYNINYRGIHRSYVE